jgi:VRR-NUC domain
VKVAALHPAMKRLEQAYHRTVLQHLKARGAPGLFYFHVPSGAFFGGKRQGAIMKSLGWIAGLPDLFLIRDGRLFALELKADGGRATDAQLEVLERLRQAGAIVAICTGIDEAIRKLENLGLLKGRECHDRAQAPRRADHER